MCGFCGGKCGGRCMTAHAKAENVQVTRAPSGVWVISDADPRVAQQPPYEADDDWFRFGHLSFGFFSYQMWGKKCRQANPVFYAFLTRFVPLAVVAFVAAVVF